MNSVFDNLKTRKKIGIFGGTFDPVHTGHMIIAEAVLEQANLDAIIFIPSARPPHKYYELMFDAKRRFKMLSEAVKNNPNFFVSDIEMNRKGPSYTVDTIREIKAQLTSETEIVFIIGKDSLYEMEMWKNPHALVEECTILVADRYCTEKRDIPGWLQAKIEIVKAPLIDISSSAIRQKIRDGKSIRYLVPDVVEKEIKKL